ALGGRGVARGSATLISGGTGTGKTSIGLHFLAGASDESPAVMFGFFDPPDALMAMAERYRLPLAPLRKRGLLTLDWRELGDETLDELGHRMLKAIDSHSAKRVVVDSITAFFNASSFPERGHRFAGALLNEFRRREVTSMFMLEPRDEPQVGLSASTEGIGKFFDNVVSLRFVDDGTRLRRQLSVIKVRRGPVDDRKLEVEIGAAGVSVINPERHPG
ncbi:MAG TPA: ATPase domain-containing protein, partial [Burkholderiaceae bacterium]|nr:ATPase domain-containing protein [Burkholderiaceae bacterium]